MPALAFLADNAAVIALVFRDRILAWLAPLGWRDGNGWHAGVAPTHDDPGRHARRGGVNSNHIGGVNP